MVKPKDLEDLARPEAVNVPVEVEIYVEADGTVVFADLAAGLLPIANELNPEAPLTCNPTPPLADTSQAESDEHQQPA